MSSVDTGWINDEAPVANASLRKRQFVPPLDEIDAAARILDPIIIGIGDNTLLFNVFLKDYAPTDW